VRLTSCILVLFLLAAGGVQAQSPNATVTGQVLDSSGAVVAQATVDVINNATNAIYSTKTNGEGIFLVPDVPPATYRVQVSHVGFKTIVRPDITLHVRDAVALNFSLPIGAVSETVTVEGGSPLIDTQDAAVSTVVDRQFAENLPLNGRSFQTLIQLTPGVVLTPSNSYDNGQFSVSGQRATSNYWTVDGVSANFGVGVSSVGTAGSALGGSIGSFSVQGGTNSLVSVDAMQEFRIQTSTYAPEFGRTPGAQISIVTRSGTNQNHGTLFEYLRNDVLDANDWFAHSAGLPKAEERQNDFGGTFSGPILKDRTFFFFSYEGLRLRLPQTALTNVPDLAARQQATPALQPYLNAFPRPNGPDNPATGIAQFNSTYSDKSTLDAYSLRIDHKAGNTVSLFGRYNYSPSSSSQRGYAPSELTLNTVLQSRILTQTGTAGVSWVISPATIDDLRFNYSRADSRGQYTLDNFGGAVPLSSLPFPSPFTDQNGLFQLTILSLDRPYLASGINGQFQQPQINLVDSLSVQNGAHGLKFGVDFRRLSPGSDPRQYGQNPYFLNVPKAETGNLLFSFVYSGKETTLLFRNLGAFAQDTWRLEPRLTLTYGLRWDVDFAPSSIGGPNILAVTGFNLNDLSQLGLAPVGTPPFSTTYGNVAPRIGVAYQLSQNRDWGSVLRGGFGVFYDLATSEAGNFNASSYPFGSSAFSSGGTFPLNAATANPPSISPENLTTRALFAFDPNLRLPYTLQWNFAVEQSLGLSQTLSATYVGAVGHRLLQTAVVSAPNANIAQADLVTNSASSNYNALQLQYQHRLSSGLQALASYTWAHSIDTASAGSAFGNGANGLSSDPKANRGPSDFDIRNAFSAGVTYDIPVQSVNALAKALFHGWSLENIVQARSAEPVSIYDSLFYTGVNGYSVNVRPDLIPGIPLYLYGPRYPGGKAINNTPGQGGSGCFGPFCPPPSDNGSALRQGNLARNALRGFGLTQWDFAVHREFPIKESLKMQFRAEMFDVLNHPNFGPPVGDLNSSQFGLSTQMFGSSLNGNATAGGFSSLYQIGGPRSIQCALKLTF
jgi:hypothetical protein